MNKKGLSVIILLAILGCIFSLILISQLDTFSWDEAHHAFFGNQIYKDLKKLDISGFLSHTSNQAWFQPFHSWLNASFFFIFGRTYLAARLSSLFMYLLLFFAIYKYSTLISKEKGWLIAAFANIFMATSPFMLKMSSLNMQEMMGAVVIMLSSIYYITRCEKFDYRNYLILGSILSAVLLTKYHYGILLGATVFLLETSRIFDIKDKIKSTKQWIINNLLILGGFVPLTALWFLTPPMQRKIGLFLYRFQDVQGGYKGFNALDRVLYYVKSIISSYTFSIWIGLFLLFSIIYSVRYFKDIRIRVLLILVVTFLAFHSTISLVFERLICPAMPAIFILAGFTATDIYQKYLKMLNMNLQKLVTILLIILIAGDLVSISPNIRRFSFTQNTQELDSRCLFGLVKRPMLLFPWDPGKDSNPNFTSKPKVRLRDVLDYCSNTIPKDKPISTLVSFLELSPYEWYWHFGDWKGNVFTTNDYPALSKYFWFSEYIIEFEIKGDSPYIVEVKDGGKSWKDASKPFKQMGWLKPYASKEFSDIGIVANIYKMKLPF